MEILQQARRIGSVARRLPWAVAIALVLFAGWTVVVRVGISHGNRESAWIPRPFGEWPAKVTKVGGSSDIQLSIVASYAATAPTATASTPSVGEIPALVGRVSIGTIVDNLDSNYINGSRFTTGIRAGPVSSISVFVPAPIDAAPHDKYQLAIYDDSRGAPLHLLASTESGTLAPDVWNTLPISATLQPKTSYWFMYNTNGSNGAVNDLTYTPVSGAALDTAIRSRVSSSLKHRADQITTIGNLTPMVLAVIAVAALAARRRRWTGVTVLSGFVVAMLIAWILRETVFQPYGGYPSGHALRLTYVAAALGYIVPRRSVRVGGWLLVLLVSVAAVYARGHYSDEIIGGILLGWAFATGAIAVGLGFSSRPRQADEPARSAS